MSAPSVASGRIFISYRREETAYPAGWLFDSLAEHFGAAQIFKDVDSIEPGDDFVDVITKAVGSCDVLLALIGDRWVAMADEDGTRRLDNPEDFVRIEIEAALARRVRVIPILIAGARMPRADELPPSLVGLVRRHALELSPSRFSFDFNRLIKVLDKTLDARAEAKRKTEPARSGGKTEPAGSKGKTEPAGSTTEPARSGGKGAPAKATEERAPAPEVKRTEPHPSPTSRGGAFGPAERAPDRAEVNVQPQAPAQWAPDPFARHELRFWDGFRWTEHVCDSGKLALDPAD